MVEIAVVVLLVQIIAQYVNALKEEEEAVAEELQPFQVWCAKIAPKLKNIWKSLRIQGFFNIFSSILMVFEVCAFWGQS